MPKQVLGEGPQQCDIVIVGEAAGADEERLGRPFVGRSGQLLDSLLTDAGIVRSQCYITNLVKEHPTNNDITPWFSDATFTPLGETARTALLNEIASRQPKVVITLGGTAKAAVTGDTRGITIVRGCPLCPSGQNYAVIPSIHPAAVLRGAWMDRYLLKADLAKARRMAAGGGIAAIPQRNLYLKPNLQEALDWIEKAKSFDEIGFDIETSFERMTCFSIAHTPTEAMSISLDSFHKSDVIRILAALKDFLEGDYSTKIVTQNGNYDTSFLREYYAIRTRLGRVEDTMCAHHVMLADLGGDERDTSTGVRVKRSSKSLALLASLYTYEPYYKDEGGKARNAGDLSAYLAYNAKDAAVTLECWETLHGDLLLRPGMEYTYRELTMSRLPAVQEMQAGGIRVDLEEYRKLKVEAETKVVELMKQLQQEVAPFMLAKRAAASEAYESASSALESALAAAKAKGEKKNADTDRLRAARRASKADVSYWDGEFNPDSAKHCSEYFYGFCGFAVRRNRKTKSVTVDDLALAEFARPGYNRNPNNAAAIIQNIREHRQQIETFLSWELDNDRFRAAFNLRGTKFGRMSSSKLFFRFGGNQQNIPPRVREVMYADRMGTRPDDYVPFFVEYDKSQAEWVVVAFESDDAGMVAAIQSGADVHAYTAALMSGIPIDEIVFEDKALNKLTSSSEIAKIRKDIVFPNCPGIAKALWLPPNMALRQAGKKSNHALNYDEGVNTFARTNSMAVSDARRLVYLYHRAYPGIKRWHAGLQMALRSPGQNKHYKRTLTNCLGREMHFLGPLNGKGADVTLRQAYACIPQSTVADIASNAMRSVVDSNEGAALRLCSNNHDSILVEHRVSREALSGTGQGYEAAVVAIVRQMQEIYSALDPRLVSTTTGKQYSIKTDSKAGLCWGKLEKIEPTEESVHKFLTKLKDDIRG